MTAGQRIALVYGVSFLGAAGVAMLRGRTQIGDLATDTILHGLAAGTVLNVVGWLVLPNGQTVPLMETAKANTVKGLGKLGAEGVKVLANVDADRLYSAMKQGGIKVGPVPDNPSIIKQDAV